jgi:hypothetical protein
MKLAGNKDGELYRLLLVAQCNASRSAMPFLFERIDDESELLLPGNLERTDSLSPSWSMRSRKRLERSRGHRLALPVLHLEKKDQVIGKVVKSEDIPAATQLFTPNWIVQYLVQNSVGRLWLTGQSRGSSCALKSQWPYYIEPAEQTVSGSCPEVQAATNLIPAGRIPSPTPVSGQERWHRARPRRRGTYPGDSSASASALANSVGLKNETG